MDDLAKTEKELAERELLLGQVKTQYDAAVAEKQRLTEAANVCIRKMTAATALINGLGDEKIRWTRQSKDFKKQHGRYFISLFAAERKGSQRSKIFSRLSFYY